MLADHQIKTEWIRLKTVKSPDEGLSVCAVRLVRWATTELEQRANREIRANQEKIERLQEHIALLIEQIEKVA